MELDLRKIANYIRKAETEELLDRFTVYRSDMEPAALDLIQAELANRGITPEMIDAHQRERYATSLINSDGTAVRCSLCEKPAIWQGWGWHKLWGYVPIIPRKLSYCEEHVRAQQQAVEDSTHGP